MTASDRTTETPHVVAVTEHLTRPGRLPLVIAACLECPWHGRYWDRADADRAAAQHEAGGA